ncbi:MAG: AraC family transcriptional regulator [Ruminococcaceae bacterium]|nr:AraC family transcriptional regulator [Oscillospiraceae bacterium]
MMLETVKYQNGGRFTSREEWIHPARIGRSYELIVMIEGEAWIEEDGIPFDLKEGDVLFLEPEKQHRGYRPSDARVSFYWFHFDEIPKDFVTEIKKHMQPFDRYTVFSLCRQLLRCVSMQYDPPILHALFYTLLGELAMQGRQAVCERSPLAVRVCEWIRINSDRVLTVNDVSEQFGYNVDYLSRLFCKTYGHGLKAEIDRRRLDDMKRLLLESDLTLSAIAERTSGGDYKLFLKFFKYHEGITPSDFRRLYSEMHTNNR